MGAARRRRAAADGALTPPDQRARVQLRQLGSIAALPAAEWNALYPGDYPLVRHDFLDALEQHGCATPDTGWTPCHAVLEDESGVAAVAPLYLKTHSYGEFVFDFSWAEASHRIRQSYYPKLVSTIPFTPSAGPRIGARDAAARSEMARLLPALAKHLGVSSFHGLFLDRDDNAAFASAGCIERNDVQFHWRNRGYTDFAAFLATLTSEKRKKILRERRRVAEAGLRFEWRRGDELSEAQWMQVYALYANTYEEHGRPPYLSLEFFLDYARKAATPVRLILAYAERSMVAVAITLVGESASGGTLYGRHWGAADRYHSLHFETCYYQGIEFCIREGLQHFDAGAQGEHKLSRGFEPVITHSQHWISDARLRGAVAHAMREERAWVAQRGTILGSHTPFKQQIDVDVDVETAPSDG
ncbi:MAG: family N-acetyltransferase [Nevskia sp.]|nr:family N-acetyltransferase [Nevskia sp.]